MERGRLVLGAEQSAGGSGAPGVAAASSRLCAAAAGCVDGDGRGAVNAEDEIVPPWRWYSLLPPGRLGHPPRVFERASAFRTPASRRFRSLLLVALTLPPTPALALLERIASMSAFTCVYYRLQHVLWKRSAMVNKSAAFRPLIRPPPLLLFHSQQSSLTPFPALAILFPFLHHPSCCDPKAAF